MILQRLICLHFPSLTVSDDLYTACPDPEDVMVALDYTDQGSNLLLSLLSKIVNINEINQSRGLFVVIVFFCGNYFTVWLCFVIG